MNKFTRRELAAALSASAVVLAQPALAQPEAPPLPANAAEELKASQAQIREAADQLDKFSLPMSTEPATVFKP
jgi:hypothetical protein